MQACFVLHVHCMAELDVYKRQEQYDRSKIEAGILRACHKRPVSAEQIHALVDSVETEIFNMEEREIPSSVIGEIVMDKLKDLDCLLYTSLRCTSSTKK